MLLNTVVIVSREIFEAASMICILMVLAHYYRVSIKWLLLGTIIGLLGAILFAVNLDEVSTLFEYRGQEFLVASIYMTLYCLLLIFSYYYTRYHPAPPFSKRDVCIFCGLLLTLISLSLVRELGEIIVYLLTQYANDQTNVSSLLFGLLLGFAIGGSVATIIFFLLIRIPRSWGVTIVKFWLAIQAGVLLMKASLLMNQINVLPYSPVLWDSSKWLSEQSVGGHILSALIGYDSRPNLTQILSFSVGCISVISIYLVTPSVLLEVGKRLRAIRR